MCAQKLTTKPCQWQWTDAAGGFASAQTWLLWLLKILSRVQQASSANTIAGKLGFSVLWCTNQRTNWPRRRQSLGPSTACTFCQWNGWSSCSRTTFHAIRRSTPTAWPTARVLVEVFLSKRCKTSASNCGVWTGLPHPVLYLFTANVPVTHKRQSTEANVQ